MKIVYRTFLAQVPATLYRNDRLVNYLYRPLIAGIMGFSIVMIVVFCGNFFSSILGIKDLTLNGFEIILAGMGFLLKFGENLLKNF